MAQTLSTTSPNLFKGVIKAGLIAGILDGTAATIHFMLKGGSGPGRVFEYIASGLFGKEAFTGGLKMQLLGFALHMTFATIWAFIFFKAYTKIELISKNWIRSGLVYGVVVWIGMNLVVIPLSNVTPPKFIPINIVISMSILMVCIGLPISYIAQQFFNKK